MHSLRRSTIQFSCCATLGVCALLPAWPAGAGELTGSLALSSDYIVHGLRRSAGEPALQAHLGWLGDRGWSAGIWASTIELHPGTGPRRELDFYIAAQAQLSRDWRLSGRLTHYEFHKDSYFLSYDYTELAGTASFRDALFFSIAAVPNYSFYSITRGAARDRLALTYELSARHPLSRQLQLTAGLGRADLRDLFGTSYWYWSGGAELAWKRLSLGVSYVGTDSSADRLFGHDLTGNTWVATAALRLL
jgi:uncharacterized protein (TIGR02001 family)